jgi:xanthine phosphoribosyltransferase
LIILKKQPSKVLYQDLFQTVVSSFTKETSYELTMAKNLLTEEDHVLIIDDFLAYGEAVQQVQCRLIHMSHATVAGAGISD